MGIFKKTIKYSKGSEDLNNKIKNLDEDLKKTGVISNSDDGKFQYLEEIKEDNNLVIEEVKLQEEELYSWREVSKDHTEEEIEEFVEEIREKHRKLSLVENSIESLKIKEAQNIFQELYQDQVEQIVEKYISSQSKDILLLREDLFLELDKKPTIDVNALEEKINLLSIKYRRLSEALNDPSKNGDPLNQNPVTLEQLKNHYQILVGRLQEKLASVGGGGEVRLKYLDDIVGIATNASVYDGKYLKYDHTLGKFVFDTINNVTGIGGTWQTDVVGINTIKNVGIGTTAKSGYKLYVEGNTRVTGILTIGQGTITLNGNTNVANIGTGVTIYGDSGIISARAFYLNGVPLVGSQGTQGIQGIQGGLSAQGRQGVQGLQGSQGVGSQGLQGLQGRQGVQGNQGTQGTQGTQGLQGLQGRQGTQGIQGVQGNQGTQGTQGLQGLQGLQGIQGRQGVQGNQGTQGIQGLSGSNAGQGTQGLQGSQGIQGRQGTQGTQGTQGLSGSQGTYGPVAGTANQVVYKDGSNDPAGSVNLIFDGNKLTTKELLVIGNVSIGGTLTYENVTNIDSIGLITARSGVKIISGGLEVISGISTFGSNVKFDAGIRDLNNNIGIAGSVLISTGSGIRWTSPYAAGLQGLQGTQGIQGNQGTQGLQGLQGTQGTQGLQGLQGIQGLQGTQGTQGLQGLQGIQGLTGSGGGIGTQWVTTAAGIHTLSNVGIGTTNPQATLQVGTGVTIYGNSGIVSATSFYGSFNGSITNATNLTGGYANASQLNVTGVTTISAGRIQADAASNLRFGNLPAGSGSSGRNIAIGDQVLVTLSGGSGRNIGIGELSYYDTTSGQYNIGLGIQAGQKITTGSYNVIIGGYNGQTGLDLRTSSNNVVIADGQGNIRQYIDSNGNVGIKTTIITEALTVAGVVSATSFSGSGIGLTNIPASKLTGVLPAIDGSNLFGVTASGSGIQIRDDGSIVGTAATVDFGTGLSVSFASGIATVSGASSVSAATTAYGLFGTPNLSIGNVTAGIITATSGSRSITANPSDQIGNTTLDLSTNTTSTYSGSRVALRNSTSTGTQLIHFNLPSNVGQYFAIEKTNSSGTYQKTISSYNYLDEAWVFYAGSSNSIQLSINQNGVGIGTTNVTSKLTVVGDANISGVATASSFSGSGSGLTNLPAGQLTGTLPAIDGSALLNVNATGSGVVVLDDNVNVGSARTLNFGTGLDVTYSATGIATITASGGSLKSRTVVTGVTTSIANNGIGNTNITGFKSYSLMKVGLSTAAWLRIYTDSTSRANDVNRSVGEDPTPGSGVIAEVVTTGISTTQIISPFVMGGNLDEPASTTIYAAITNLSGSTQAITANLTILQLEA